MLLYWPLDSGDLSYPAGRTVSSHFAKDKPVPDLTVPARNRAERRHNLKVHGTERPVWATSRGGKMAASAADLVNRLAVALNQKAAEWGIQKRLEKMEPMIEAALGKGGGHLGALLECRCIEWDTRDFAGNRAVSAFDIVINGYGGSPWEVNQSWNSRAQLTAGAPEGWHFKSAHVWAWRGGGDDGGG